MLAELCGYAPERIRALREAGVFGEAEVPRVSERDFVGYGATPPDPKWPGGARLALNFVLNYEEGGENTPLEGDPASEAFLHEVVGAPADGRPAEPEHRVDVRVRQPRRLLARAPDLRQARAAADRLRGRPGARAESRRRRGRWSRRAGRWRATAGAGSTTWRCPRTRSASTCGARSRRSSASPGSARSAGTRGGSRTTRAASSSRRAASSTTPTPTPTSCPTGSRSPGKQHLVIPYTLDANDFKFLLVNGFVTGDQFYAYLVDAFDQLREEGGRMLSVGLHCRIVGRPGRAKALDAFLALRAPARGRVGDDPRRDRAPLARAPPARGLLTDAATVAFGVRHRPGRLGRTSALARANTGSERDRVRHERCDSPVDEKSHSCHDGHLDRFGV